MNMDIEALVIKQVQTELSEMDLKDIIQSEVRAMISNEVGKEIIQGVEAVAQAMIITAVNEQLDGEVSTDDGWGKKVSYPSFEGLFRKTLKEAMSQKYEVTRTIERSVKDRVQKLMANEYKGVVEKIVDELTQSKIKGKD